MKNALLRVFAIGCTIKIEFDHGKCYVELWHHETMNARARIIEFDDDFDKNLPLAIDGIVKDMLQNKIEIA